SDRIAMAVLIQDMLVVGDPGIGRVDAFSAQYTQEELCEYKSRAHFLLWQRYRPIAELVESTLQTPNPSARPAPAQWKEALRQLYRQAPWRRHTLHADDNAGICISLDVPGSQDLTTTPFGIRGNFVRSEDGWASFLSHEGAKVRLRSAEQGWRWIESGSEARLENGDLIYDHQQGRFPARFRIEGVDPAAEAAKTALESFEAGPEHEPTEQKGWLPEWILNLEPNQTIYFLVGFAAIIILIALLYRIF